MYMYFASTIAMMLTAQEGASISMLSFFLLSLFELWSTLKKTEKSGAAIPWVWHEKLCIGLEDAMAAAGRSA